jgi:hypothetical protein
MFTGNLSEPTIDPGKLILSERPESLIFPWTIDEYYSGMEQGQNKASFTQNGLHFRNNIITGITVVGYAGAEKVTPRRSESWMTLLIDAPQIEKPRTRRA